MHASASSKAILLLSLALGSLGASQRHGYPLTAASLRTHAGSQSQSARSVVSGSHDDQPDGEAVWGAFGGKRITADRSGAGHELTQDGKSYVHDTSFIKIGEAGHDEVAAHEKVHDHLWAHRHAQAIMRGEKVEDGYGAKNLSYGDHEDFQKELQMSLQDKVKAQHEMADKIREDRDRREQEACDKIYTTVKKSKELRLAPQLKKMKDETKELLGELVVFEDRQVWKAKPLTRAQFTELFGAKEDVNDGKPRMAIEDIDEYEVLLASGEIGTVFNANFSRFAVYDNAYAEPAEDFFWRRAPAFFEVEGKRPKVVKATDSDVDKKVIAAQMHESRKIEMKLDAAAASHHVAVRMIKFSGDDEAQATTHSHFMKVAAKKQIAEGEWAKAKDTVKDLSAKDLKKAMQDGKKREEAYVQAQDAKLEETSAANERKRLEDSKKRLQAAVTHAQEAEAQIRVKVEAGGVVSDVLLAKHEAKKAALKKAEEKLAEVSSKLNPAPTPPVATAPSTLPPPPTILPPVTTPPASPLSSPRASPRPRTPSPVPVATRTLAAQPARRFPLNMFPNMSCLRTA